MLRIEIKMYMLIILCLTFFEEGSASAEGREKVCMNYKSYENPDRYDDCYYNPDLDSTPEEISKRYGFYLREHTVTTDDGYILTIFQISMQHDHDKKQKQPVILQHGIFVDGTSWIISGNESLAFVLTRNGFDLWIPNFRGTTYSKQHVNPSITPKKYWNFSFHELGIYDLSAIIQYVSKHTKRTDILYIGHSMGCTAFMVYSSIKVSHAQKHIKGVLYLAPVAYFKHPPPILQLVLPFSNLIKGVLDSLKIFSLGLEVKKITSISCTKYPTILGCQLVLAIVSGIVIEQIRTDMIPLIVKYFPTDSSVITLLHYAQIAKNHGRFQQFDYGIENIIKYQSLVPPRYDLEKVQIPCYIFAGAQDLVAEITDVQHLYDVIRASKKMHVYELSHLDYMYGKNLTNLYNDILDALDTFVNKNI